MNYLLTYVTVSESSDVCKCILVCGPRHFVTFSYERHLEIILLTYLLHVVGRMSIGEFHETVSIVILPALGRSSQYH